MQKFTDCFGLEVRLTDERLAHITEHPEMREMEPALAEVLRMPQIVRASRSDSAVRLFYAFFSETAVTSKWLCVVVKCEPADTFVITAYLTNKPKRGEDLWPIK